MASHISLFTSTLYCSLIGEFIHYVDQYALVLNYLYCDISCSNMFSFVNKYSIFKT